MQEPHQTIVDQALVKVPGNASREASSPDGRASGISPLAALRRRPLLAVLIFLVVAGAGLPVVTRKAKPLFYVNSVIYVPPTVEGTLKDGRQRPQYDIQQKMLMIPRYDVVSKTIQKLRERGADPRLPGETEQGAADRIGRDLEITHGSDNYEISVGMHSSNPDGLAEILNCLTETFIEISRANEFYGEDRRIETLNGERRRLESELNEDLQLRSDIAREVGVVGFEELPADKLVETTRSALDQARRERIEAEAEVSLLERDASLAAKLVASTAGIDPTESPSKQRLEERRGELERLMAGLTPKHPDYQALALELAQIDKQWKEASKPNVREARQVDEPSQLLGRARIELERARKAETELNLELARDIAKVDSTTGEFQRGRELGTRIEQLRNQITVIDDRLSYFRIEANAPGSLRVSSPARTPLLPEKNSRNKYLAGLMALALAASVAGVAVIDMTRAKILTASDIERILASRH